MKTLRWLAFPFAWIYASIMTVRNLLFDWGIWKTLPLPQNSIGVGNLSVGGTGKSVLVNYLLQQAKERGRTAVLSRGYGRKSKGYILADAISTAEQIGDEPYQFWKRHPDVYVAVAESRQKGMQRLMALQPAPDYYLLDDVFQHRWVAPKKMILCTRYDALFADDYVLPMGRLREPKSGKKRAQLCLVTNCPPSIRPEERAEVRQKLALSPEQALVFSRVEYSQKLAGSATIAPDQLHDRPLVVVTGIARPQRFLEALRQKGFHFKSFCFPDHHHFRPKEIAEILEAAAGGNILTTEKDYGRLVEQLASDKLYYWPIELAFMSPEDQQLFEKVVWA